MAQDPDQTDLDPDVDTDETLETLEEEATLAAEEVPPLVGVVMGSQSDWPTMSAARDVLVAMGVPHEIRIVSAHRTPDRLFAYAEAAADRGLRAIIAGAGGAAHLPGMLAAKTRVPVLGVPVRSKALSGLDSLLSIVQMPRGVPVGTLAIGEAGAANAALLAVAMLATTDPELAERLEILREAQTEGVAEEPHDD
ncbi:5-(carboxyamino)imidazole ribonucleotide mutase [Albimonas pacifica]|uniref:N5-carboxyaminoimidazole ribonucleotide mutase n=2 Tax=Albimonas pacifica TaxID=1114924 RepID=A0A1I3F488_9RHOB|nr:5-(carboxyamino)imidazole ribonucleotide mutase [Albimonas pacifica]